MPEVNVKRRVLLLAAALAVLLPAALPAGAHDRREQQLDRIEAEIARTRELIREANAERRGLLERIAESDRRRDALAERIGALGLELEEARARLEAVQASLGETREELLLWTRRLDEARDRLADRRLTLAERAAAAYRLGPAGLVDVVLGAQDLRSLADSVRFVRSVLVADSALVEGIEVARAQVAEQRSRVASFEERLAARRDAVRAEVRRIGRLKAEQEALRAEVEREIAAREALLEGVEESRAAYVAAVRELEEESARIRALLQEAGSTGSGRAGGQLLWPTSGAITSGFGWRVHPIFGTRRFHAGVDIDGSCGQPIWAADDGRVISAGWNGGYGLAVIVDHGDGLATLYAHQSALAVATGQDVARGQVIGSVGTTGWSTGCHLHFEVRVNGSPVDPVPYL